MYATPPSGLPELVRANAVTFEVAQPSDTTVREMVDSLSLAGLSDEGDADIRDICDRLGELREPSAIAALVRLARGAPTADTPKVPEGVTRAARRALTRYADPALTPLWIELLGKDAELAIAQLSKSGDARAIGPLRRLAFGSYRTVMPDGRRMFNPQGLDAALALRGLGDDDALTFLRWEARRGMDAHDMRTWQQAVGFALQAMSDAELPTALRHEHPGVRYAALGPAERRGRVDVMAAALSDVDRRVRKRAVDALAGPYRTLDATPAKTAAREQALTGALDDAELTIRRAAALALASAGNRAAEALLRRDLVSADHATRMRARAALGALRRSR
jgi:HEAT repeat protein